jgi:hypothetical protein
MNDEPSNEWDKQGIRAACQWNERTLSFFTDLARRKRTTWETTIDVLTDQYGFSGRESRELFQELEACLCGDYIVGRKGYSTRFEWSVRAVDVAKDALANVSLEVTDGGEFSVGGVDSNTNSRSRRVENSQLRPYHFPLRPGLDVQFDLPVDVTENEVLRLSLFLQSLPHASEVPDKLREVFSVETSDVGASLPKDASGTSAEELDPLATIPIEAPSPESEEAGRDDFSRESRDRQEISGGQDPA